MHTTGLPVVMISLFFQSLFLKTEKTDPISDSELMSVNFVITEYIFLTVWLSQQKDRKSPVKEIIRTCYTNQCQVKCEIYLKPCNKYIIYSEYFNYQIHWRAPGIDILELRFRQVYCLDFL